ncbi:MAG: ATP-grasp domain-containing protein [Chloroflexaceae bacterium]|jgi:acetyl/propionyl-CoA carboxylase alpha subunit|nr:ATP-grasp domain-containing protein [Chloroflexaceae bacterium]
MFNKVLIANRGEIAVRIIRTCRDMGLQTVALYEQADLGSLHVRLSDESVPLTTEAGFTDHAAILQIARELGADAIHPGYGFLAEEPSFIRECAEAGIAFVGPPAEVVATLHDKIGAQERAREAGFTVPRHSGRAYGPEELDELRAEAERIGYPLVVKSVSGGRGSGTRLVRSADQLEPMVRQAETAAAAVFGSPAVYLEQAILPSHYVEVQLLADSHGTIVHLGERDGSIQRNNQKLLEESPAPYLSQTQRENIWRLAIELARLFGCQGACSVEFVVDRDGQPYFTEIKARIQVEHPVSEMVSQIDIVREQLRIAAGEPLGYKQSDIQLRGWAMQCRINAEDPWNRFLPSPGRLRLFRAPGGPGVRVDTYAYSSCDIPARYDPVFAKLAVWGENRFECIMRTRRALEDFAISGIQTNLPLHQRVISAADFLRGDYTTEFSRRPLLDALAVEEDRRNLAVAAAIAYAARNAVARAATPERVLTGWHRGARKLPE